MNRFFVNVTLGVFEYILHFNSCCPWKLLLQTHGLDLMDISDDHGQESWLWMSKQIIREVRKSRCSSQIWLIAWFSIKTGYWMSHTKWNYALVAIITDIHVMLIIWSYELKWDEMNEWKRSPEKTQDYGKLACLAVPYGYFSFPTAGNNLKKHGKAANKSQVGGYRSHTSMRWCLKVHHMFAMFVK